MTQHPSQQYASPSGGGADPANPGNGGDRWSRRPRRSANDRKIAGVAGGLGRAFGIDPIILRVAFVVLAIFGGSGVLLYALGWLLLPAEGDEVSGIEGLIGRGRTSLSPMFTILLIVIALFSAGSVFSWGLPFWPVVIGAFLFFVFARRHRVPPGGGNATGRRDWNQWGDDVSARATRWADDFSHQASRWGGRAGQWGSHWTAGAPSRSPFDGPAFWDADPTGARPSNSPQATPASSPFPSATSSPSPQATPSPSPQATPSNSPSPSEMLTDNRTPPAWDPLGVAPFAWDLPDPSPVPDPPMSRPHRSGRSGLSRAFVGVALLAGALAALEVIAGWWTLSWAEVSAIALAVVGVGLILAALRGRGRPLIGPGIFLALLTLALTITGLSGTQHYGDQVWTPSSVADVDNLTFSWNAGDGKLDLSGLDIPADTTATTTLDVRAGQATVLVPANVTVHATCSANVGHVDCLTVSDDGMRPSATATALPASGSTAGGTLDLTVRVGAGKVTVRHG